MFAHRALSIENSRRDVIAGNSLFKMRGSSFNNSSFVRYSISLISDKSSNSEVRRQSIFIYSHPKFWFSSVDGNGVLHIVTSNIRTTKSNQTDQFVRYSRTLSTVIEFLRIDWWSEKKDPFCLKGRYIVVMNHRCLTLPDQFSAKRAYSRVSQLMPSRY